MKSYHVEVRVKNNYMHQTLKKAGYKSLLKFCAQHNISYAPALNLMNLREPALTKKGTVRPIVLRIMEALSCSLESLFPPEHLSVPLRNNKSSFEADIGDIQVLAGSLHVQQLTQEDQVEREWMDEKVRAALNRLNTQERRVIMRRFGIDCEPATLAEIGSEFGVGKERVRQIEARSTRKMRDYLRGVRHAERFKEVMTKTVDMTVKSYVPWDQRWRNRIAAVVTIPDEDAEEPT